jgi:tRNA threonylcarbamoyladenosine biosynthesis protein TsaE
MKIRVIYNLIVNKFIFEYMELISKTYGLDALPLIAKELAVYIGSGSILCFEGDLGAGKTTLIKELCKELGVQDLVSSPTFSLVNEYVATGPLGNSTILHIDLYRLRDEQEAIDAGIEEQLFSGSICLVEWPQRAPGIIPEYAMHVILSATDDSHRQIKVLSAEN